MIASRILHNSSPELPLDGSDSSLNQTNFKSRPSSGILIWFEDSSENNNSKAIKNISLGLNTTFLTCSSRDVERSSNSDTSSVMPNMSLQFTERASIILLCIWKPVLYISSSAFTHDPAHLSPATTAHALHLLVGNPGVRLLGEGDENTLAIRTREDWQRRALCVGMEVVR